MANSSARSFNYPDPLPDRTHTNPFTGKPVAPMTNPSPAAEAIWNTYNAAFDEAGVFTDYGDALAAALRALADQVVPANGSRKNNEIRAEILAIADELGRWQ